MTSPVTATAATTEESGRETLGKTASPAKAPASPLQDAAKLYWIIVLVGPVVWYFTTPGATVNDAWRVFGRLLSSIVTVPLMVLSGQLEPSKILQFLFPGHF